MSQNENTKHGKTDMFSRGMKWLRNHTKISKKDVESGQQQHEMKEQKHPGEKKENVNAALPVNNEVRKQKPPKEKKKTVDVTPALQEEKEKNVNSVPSVPPRANKKTKKRVKKVEEKPSGVVKQESISLKQDNVQNQMLNETQVVLKENKNATEKDESKELKEITNVPNHGETRQLVDVSADNMDNQNIPKIPINKEDASKPKEQQVKQTKTENEQCDVQSKNENGNSSSSISVFNIITKTTQTEQIVTSNEKKNQEVPLPVYEVKSKNIEAVYADQINTSKSQRLQKISKNENDAVNLKTSSSLKCQVNHYQEKHTETVQIKKTQSFSSKNQTRSQYNQAKDQTRKEAIDTTLNLLSKNQEFTVDRDKQESYNSNNQLIGDTKISTNAESVKVESNQSQHGDTIKINQASEYIKKEFENIKFVDDHFSDQNTKSNIATYTFEESHTQEEISSNNIEELNLIKEATESFKEIQKEIEELENLVENFTGTTNDSDEYYYLDETLMKCLFKLDNVPSKNIPTIREKRREGIKYVQRVIKRLDQKIKENQKQTTDQILST